MITTKTYFECNDVMNYIHQLKSNIQIQKSRCKSKAESAIFDVIIDSVGSIQTDFEKMKRYTLSVEVAEEENVVYFSLNNWFAGRDYPIGEPFDEWVTSHIFSDDEFCKSNKLCVRRGNIDMSVNWCVTAPREWVEKYCPKLLSDESYTYVLYSHSPKGDYMNTYAKKYSEFIFHPNEYGEVEDRFGWPFLEYTSENFGSFLYEPDEEE